MSRSALLEKQYIRLLQDHGCELPWGIPGIPPILLDKIKNLPDEVKKSLKNSKNNIELRALLGIIETNEKIRNLWGVISEKTEADAREAGLTWDMEVFAGDFPTGSINAQATLVTGGALVLINEGLLTFIGGAIDCLAYELELSKYLDEADKNRRLQPSSHQIKQVTQKFSDVVLEYMLYKDATTRDEIDRIKRMGMGLSDLYEASSGLYDAISGLACADLYEACTGFVLAHEYGHIIAGHLKSCPRAAIRTPVGELELVRKSWKDECEADLLAGRIMLASLKRPLGPAKYDSLERRGKLLVAGSLFFFLLDQMLSQMVKEILQLQNVFIINDHPEPSLRSKNLKDFFKDAQGAWILQLNDTIESSFSLITEGVIRNIQYHFRE